MSRKRGRFAFRDELLEWSKRHVTWGLPLKSLSGQVFFSFAKGFLTRLSQRSVIPTAGDTLVTTYKRVILRFAYC